MRKLPFFVCFLVAIFFCCNLSAQVTLSGVVQDTASYDKIFTKAEIAPEFTGGLKSWKTFLEKNLDASLAYRNGAPSGSYRVAVQFIVAKDGRLSAIKSLTKHGYGMEEEIVRVMKLSPKWVPAIQNGRQVNCYHFVPVTLIVP
jgi:periplasmic protein TonB